MTGKMNEDENKPSYCCISHEFYKAALRDPGKIAVIHARCGAKISSEFRSFYDKNATTDTGQFAASHDSSNGKLDDHSENIFNEFIATNAVSSHPPVYEGDECFTYSDILAAVDSLSYRLRHILDGGDDPYLIKPTSDKFSSNKLLFDVISNSSESSTLDVGLYDDKQNTYIPKILGIYMVPSVQYVVAVLSVLRCGAAFVPLDTSWPKERILSVVDSSKTKFIIWHDSSLDGSFSQQFETSHWLVHCSGCPTLFLSIKDRKQVQHNALNFVWPCENERLRLFCYLMYTSGSTGKPKAVCGTEIGLLNRFSWMQESYPLHGEEHLLFKASISFVDHLQEFLGGLLTTCTLVVPPFNKLKENLFCVVDYLQSYSINRLISVPSLMRAVLPALESPQYKRVQNSLQLLVLSGEVLHISLWDSLSKLLPKTTILNLYGSTEVSGDCTYFDCKMLPLILESEALSSVPIGKQLCNCNVVLIGENVPYQGEICVRGLCVARGYFNYPSITPLNNTSFPLDSCYGCFESEIRSQLYSASIDLGSLITGCTSQYYFRTGDFARQLPGGELVFLGRKDRTIKVNGQRIALEEIESTLREHPEVFDAAVISREGHGDLIFLEAYLVTQKKVECTEILIFAIRNWLVSKLPVSMIPCYFTFVESLPMSSTGKVNYTSLASSKCPMKNVSNEIKESPHVDLLQVIKKAFSDALMVKKVSDDDDFFEMGGNSISAAHASYNLGINMRWLYAFSSPWKLHIALTEKEGFSACNLKSDAFREVDLTVPEQGLLLSSGTTVAESFISKPLRGRLLSTFCDMNTDYPIKCLKKDSNLYINPRSSSSRVDGFWNSRSIKMMCSFSRCNKIMYGGEGEAINWPSVTWPLQMAGDKKGSMRELWKVHMESCIDASPLVVFTEGNIYLFIGSHSHKFVCISVKSGFVRWETKLEGRVECSAAILDDFSQVVVGCYQGKIYFIDFLNGSICWTFQTHGEVKSLPVVDKCRHLIWCGSYDHNLYALDYRDYCCVYKLGCGGSIFGSPAIDEVHDKLYVASTNGRMTALSIKEFPFSKLWLQEFEAPIFGSLSINSCNGNVLFCLVDGHVVALDMDGSIAWMAKTGGPIFAGPCISCTLPSQVLICSRDGSIYSFNLETGDLLWEHHIGDPITSSAYVDECFEILSDDSYCPDRLICVATSSGNIHLLRIKLDSGETNGFRKNLVQEFARLDLPGDIFSSPVMISGRIFIGCRDDYVYCIGVENKIS